MLDDQPIFVVEDQASNNPSVVEILAEGGRVCERFSSPDSFLTKYRAGANGCLVLCHPSSEGSALELQQRISESRWPLRTIFVVPPEDAKTAVAAMKQGAFEVLLNPVARDALLDAVEAILTQRRPRRNMDQSEADSKSSVAMLSPREREVMAHLVAGYQTKEIARKLAIAPRTVKAHRASIRGKLKVGSTARVIRMGLEFGISL